MKLKFSKMHGLGNDFMVIDGVNQQVSLDPKRIVAWADRHFGIGFDQLLVVEAPRVDDVQFRYRIFNADGGEVAQCGNGARCFARFVREHGLTDDRLIRVETDSGILELRVVDETRVEVNMGIPDFEPAHIPFVAERRADHYQLEIGGQCIQFSALSMGNPHAVIQVDDVDNAHVQALGRALQSHARFPQSVNVGFMQVLDSSRFRLRVYERGSGETLACGSGACAAMAAGRQLGLLDEQVTADLTGGNLQLNWRGENSPVMMTGDTAMVYEGEMTI